MSPEGSAERGAWTAAEEACVRRTSRKAVAAPWRNSQRGLSRSAQRLLQSAWNGQPPAWMASQAAAAACAVSAGSSAGRVCNPCSCSQAGHRPLTGSLSLGTSPHPGARTFVKHVHCVPSILLSACRPSPCSWCFTVSAPAR